jgi:predicted DNA-binding protein
MPTQTESVSTRLTPQQISRLDELAAQRGITRSAAISTLLELAFEQIAIQSLVDVAVQRINTVANAHLEAIETLLPTTKGGVA